MSMSCLSLHKAAIRTSMEAPCTLDKFTTHSFCVMNDTGRALILKFYQLNNITCLDFSSGVGTAV